MNMTNNIIQNTHRGEPFVLINSRDAQNREIDNGDMVSLESDVGDSSNCLPSSRRPSGPAR